MNQKIALVTGATNGIGESAATMLAQKAYHVIIASRSESKCQATLEKIRKETGSKALEYIVVDLAEGKSIEEFVRKIQEKHGHLDLLINNAGGFFNERKTNSEGYEYTFALNHLGYFRVTLGLLDLLKAADAPRIINLASEAQKQGHINFDDLMAEEKYSGFGAYCQSKLANILFTKELYRKTGITTHAVHPGVVATGFGLNSTGCLSFLIKIFQPFMRKSDKGAETPVWLATNPKIAGTGGKYWADKKEKDPIDEAKDPEVAKRLWEVSLELTGLQDI